MKAFDHKFGKNFFDGVPSQPGVYFAINRDGLIVYVGKAKNLKRRLRQYRNTQRIKKHRKMKLIVAQAHRFEVQICTTELEASLLEIELIQKLKPKLNVASAYSFLYPYLGLKFEGGNLNLVYSTTPDSMQGFQSFGAFRSRRITLEAFHALTRLTVFLAHPNSTTQKVKQKYTIHRSFRNFPENLYPKLQDFLRGKSPELLSELSLQLLEYVGARADASQVQDDLRHLKRFYGFECKSLAKILEHLKIATYPVTQEDRDRLWILYKNSKSLPSPETPETEEQPHL